jgi:hypothetical protein
MAEKKQDHFSPADITKVNYDNPIVAIHHQN